MKLTITKRSKATKKEAKRVRRSGKIPAVIYSSHKSAENISVDDAEYQTIMRKIKSGGLPTEIFTLVDEDGNERKAVVKDVQYHVTTYRVLHLDFLELADDVLVNINVPIRCKGVVECAGIKLGGVLRQVIRHCKVRCFPKDIPAQFELDVENLGLMQSLKLNKLAIPEQIKPLSKMEEVAVVIAKR